MAKKEKAHYRLVGPKVNGLRRVKLTKAHNGLAKGTLGGLVPSVRLEDGSLRLGKYAWLDYDSRLEGEASLRNVSISNSVLKGDLELSRRGIEGAHLSGVGLFSADHYRVFRPMGSEHKSPILLRNLRDGSPRLIIGCWTGHPDELMAEVRRRKFRYWNAPWTEKRKWVGQYRSLLREIREIVANWE